MTLCRLILIDSMLSLFVKLDKKVKIGYNMYRRCISALNEKLIKRASLGSKQDILK